jgi:hypothetical protein
MLPDRTYAHESELHPYNFRDVTDTLHEQ